MCEWIMSWMHYATETFKMRSWGLTLLKFDHLTTSPILREIKLRRIQTVQNHTVLAITAKSPENKDL